MWHSLSSWLIEKALEELNLEVRQWFTAWLPTRRDKVCFSLRVCTKMATSYSSYLWGLGPWGSRTHGQEPADLPRSLRCRPLDESQLKQRSPSRWLLGIVHRYGLLAYPIFNKKLEVFTWKFEFLVSLNELEDLATLNCSLVGLDEQSWETASLFWWPLALHLASDHWYTLLIICLTWRHLN